MFTADGRQVGATVHETGTTVLDVTDGGETWSDLWMDGYVGRTPTRAVHEKLDAICRMYRVAWDKPTRTIRCPVEVDGSPKQRNGSLPHRSPSTGWRLWLSERDPMAERADAIVQGCAHRVASRMGG